MRDFRRPLLLAAAFTVTAAVSQATAQTIVVTKAPPGATVELGLNAETIGTATADAAGIATLPVNLAAHGRKPERGRAHLRRCVREGAARHPDRNRLGGAAACRRLHPARDLRRLLPQEDHDIVVVSAAEQAQAVWIKQGPAPDTWLRDVPVETKKRRSGHAGSRRASCSSEVSASRSTQTPLRCRAERSDLREQRPQNLVPVRRRVPGSGPGWRSRAAT